MGISIQPDLEKVFIMLASDPEFGFFKCSSKMRKSNGKFDLIYQLRLMQQQKYQLGYQVRALHRNRRATGSIPFRGLRAYRFIFRMQLPLVRSNKCIKQLINNS
jgi:hypothetical protein